MRPSAWRCLDKIMLSCASGGRCAAALMAALIALLAEIDPSEAETTFEEKLALGATRHGADGNSKMAGAPSLAGQPAIFPVSQLILCREGLRTSEQVRLSPLPSNHHDLWVVR